MFLRWLAIILPDGKSSLSVANVTTIVNVTLKITIVCQYELDRIAHKRNGHACVSGRETRLCGGCNLCVLFLGWCG